MPDPHVYSIIGHTPPGPGPIQTVAEYFRYWEGAAELLRGAAAPGVPTADRLAARDLAWELITATKQVVNNPALCAAIHRELEARFEARARAEGHIL